MLLQDCRPGAVVTYRRPPFTFAGIVATITTRGNVLVCVGWRNGERIPPLFLSVPPERVDSAPTAPQVVGQTEPR